MQTINDKRKYEVPQLFKILTLSFDTGLGLYSSLINGPVKDGLFEVSPDLNQPLLQFIQVTYWLLLHVYAILCATLDSVINRI